MAVHFRSLDCLVSGNQNHRFVYLVLQEVFKVQRDWLIFHYFAVCGPVVWITAEKRILPPKVSYYSRFNL